MTAAMGQENARNRRSGAGRGRAITNKPGNHPHSTRIAPHLTALLHFQGGGISEAVVFRTIFFLITPDIVNGGPKSGRCNVMPSVVLRVDLMVALPRTGHGTTWAR